MRRFFRTRTYFAIALGMLLVGQQAAHAQFGVVISGAGPVNRGMGGASTAAPIDAMGTLYWNPAGITGLCGSELGVGLEGLYADSHLSSSVPANTFGPGIPPVSLSGRSRSDSGVYLLPTVGLVYQPEESHLVFGLGLFSAGGFAVDYPASIWNPILSPQAPRGLGLGAVSAELQVFQVAPTVAMRLTDNLSIGIAPTLSLAHLNSDPAFLAAPDDANGDGFFTYPSATHGRLQAGGGVQAGIFYNMNCDWHFGASVKSPQWFETFRYNGVDELGRPRPVHFRFDFPLMASVGASYTGIDRLILATDFRWIDYANTPGFDGEGFDPTTGAVRGLAWRSIYVAALGAQYDLTQCCAVRLGYTYNTNPIRDDKTMFNVESPLIAQHTIYGGASYKFTPTFQVSAAYVHAFENSVQGPIVLPVGAIPGTSVRSEMTADALVFGATIKF